MKRLSRYFQDFMAVSLLLFSVSAHAELININLADAATLDHYLLGIGEKKAQRMIEYREEQGAFASIEEIMEVKGIGEKTFEKNRHRLSISEGISRIGQKSKETKAVIIRTVEKEDQVSQSSE
ncbi:MAG: ComEA family DNA-binding protein [bacterium]